MDLKSTLNLPNADFTIPMKADLAQREPQIQAKWESMRIYHLIQAARADAPSFVYHDGPPYTNSPIHLGTALNKILKDFVIKSRTMMGFRTAYIPGFDNHGLPIEQAVAKAFAERKETPTQDELRKACRAHAAHFIEVQTAQFKRLGVFGLWEKPYKTMDFKFEAEIVRVFGKLALSGYVYRGLRPTLWSPTSRTALADTEIVYKDHVSKAIYVRFALVDDPNRLLEGLEGVSTVIWTTTPWTIPANLACAFHPELDYAVVAVGDQHFIVLESLVPRLAEVLGWTSPVVVKSLQGINFDGMTFKHPLFDRTSLAVMADYVTTEDGTGVVHTAPGHGRDDFYTGQKYGLPVLCPVDERGVMTAEAGEFAGLFYEKANPVIVERLREAGALLREDDYTHSYPHAERDEMPVIFRATEQWFVAIDHEDLRARMLAETETVNWVPESGANRIRSMIGGRPDWCISRQRPWGVGIPVFYGLPSREPVYDHFAFEVIASLIEQDGSDAWFTRSPSEILPSGYVHPVTGETEFAKETDVLDVWFDSGSTHQVVYKTNTPEWTDDFPVDLYLEGSDQHRGWFNSSMVISTALEGTAPYKEVVTHGFVTDEQGRKMAKRLGNVIEPIAACDQYGADVLRLWVASIDYQNDMPCGETLLKRIGEDYRRIRNTLRFLLSNLDDYEPNLAPDKLQDIDEWIVEQADLLVDDCATFADADSKGSYARYAFREVATAIHNFCGGPLSGFYLDVIKDRMYCDGKDWASRRSVQAASYEVLLRLTKLAAPILMHTAEEVYERIPLNNKLASVHMETFDFPTQERLSEIEASELQVRFAALLEFRSYLNAALETWKTENQVKDSQDILVHVRSTEETIETLKSFGDELPTLLKVSWLEFEVGESQLSFSLSPYEKCERSRIRRPDVEKVGEHFLTKRDRKALGL